MLKVNVLDLDGQVVEELELEAAVFGIEVNEQILFDAVMLQRHSLRQGTHDTKNRTEVRGGGRKPWRQKGTGRARQGSIRSPQWRGGGVVFGPTPRSYAIKMNRKVRRLAMQSALSKKLNDNELKVVQNLDLNEIKTKAMVSAMDKLNLTNKTLFVVSEVETFENAYLSLRNIPNAMMLSVETLNVYDLLNADEVVLTKQAALDAGLYWNKRDKEGLTA